MEYSDFDLIPKMETGNSWPQTRFGKNTPSNVQVAVSILDTFPKLILAFNLVWSLYILLSCPTICNFQSMWQYHSWVVCKEYNDWINTIQNMGTKDEIPVENEFGEDIPYCNNPQGPALATCPYDLNHRVSGIWTASEILWLCHKHTMMYERNENSIFICIYMHAWVCACEYIGNVWR